MTKNGPRFSQARSFFSVHLFVQTARVLAGEFGGKSTPTVSTMSTSGHSVLLPQTYRWLALLLIIGRNERIFSCRFTCHIIPFVFLSSLSALKTLWEDETYSGFSSIDADSPSTSEAQATPSSISSSSRRLAFDEAFVPLEKFFDDSIQFFDSQRLGGLESHLKKTLKSEIQSARSFETEYDFFCSYPGTTVVLSLDH